ncbi:hypothetical protein CMI37_07710 [Candidatus Pacearchaeota archaeon]|nr:hypothetical protein [Candidatus Pacearchaeota archaeon]|tara:strand:- start:3006 stop:3194 length:189 start_codon:yes stop_codon:yes gene_type:complete
MDPLRLIAGVAFITFSIFLLIFAKSILAFAINLTIGILLLAFEKAENQIEERKDLKPQKTKK